MQLISLLQIIDDDADLHLWVGGRNMSQLVGDNRLQIDYGNHSLE
jgi:hypothetical protein